jgi:hypothetical protein
MWHTWQSQFKGKAIEKIMNAMLNQIPRIQRTLGAILATFVFLSIVAFPALAQSPGSSGTNSDAWEVTAAPYVMLPWMNGNVAIGGSQNEVNVGPGDILSNLQFAAMGYFEARKGKWGAGVDAVYMALGSNIDRPSANIDLNQHAYSFIGLRQLHEKVDLVFGMRWNRISGKIDFKGPILQGTFEETKNWVNPIVGVKLKQPLGSRYHFAFEGDIGGFGAGSDFAWNLFPTFGVDINKRFAIEAGYRVLSENFDTDSGDRYFKYDVVTQAMVLGMTLKF